MLLGLALIGLRENLHKTGRRWDTDGQFKHTLSVHYYTSTQTKERYTFSQLNKLSRCTTGLRLIRKHSLTWLVAWMNSCAFARLAIFASSILKSRAVTERHRENKKVLRCYLCVIGR